MSGYPDTMNSSLTKSSINKIVPEAEDMIIDPPTGKNFTQNPIYMKNSNLSKEALELIE